MDVYKYVAESNPEKAKEVIDSFGYDYANTPDMGLSQLVAQKGEIALKAIMENHPDKDIIIEMFSEKKQTACGCGCGDRKIESFVNASGNDSSREKETPISMVAQQTNLMILVSALFIFTALIIKK
jgi:hypothetical protein